MLLRTTLLASCLLFLVSCKPEISTGSELEMTTFTRSGGTQCLGAPGVTEDNTHCATFKISYPKALEADNADASGKISQFIQQQLLDYSDEQGNKPKSLDEMANLFIGDYLKDPNPSSSWELERTVEVVFNSPSLLTLAYSENGSTGGAHPFSGQRYFVFDLKTGEQLGLKHLLTSGYDAALSIAGEKAFRQSRNIAEDANLEDEGFWFENGVFMLNDNVGVLKEGLAFNFNAYEVAPYAMGDSGFTIPYEDIRGLIPANGLLETALR